MTVRFHPPEDREAYAAKAAAVLLQAALPEAQAQLAQLVSRRQPQDIAARGLDREGDEA